MLFRIEGYAVWINNSNLTDNVDFNNHAYNNNFKNNKI